jgi:hypothetical protein
MRFREGAHLVERPSVEAIPRGLQWPLTAPSSGHPPAGFACLRLPFMSTLRVRHTAGLPDRSVTHQRHQHPQRRPRP